ncbi:unnamed protein product [Hermetia illucens]|uniref:Uncharacterized protein n=1 Tax=Hermetia illucens TaxID=343691 RepID=A0A7R8YZ54_HERIL|nr:unnamed protein product [Hermetia illucens]
MFSECWLYNLHEKSRSERDKTLSPACLYNGKGRLNLGNRLQRLEELFAQQLEEMEALYGGNLIVPMPSDTMQRDFTGSTRSSLSSYSEG